MFVVRDVPADDAGSAASPARGKRLFLQCVACHDLDADATASLKVGPNLHGILGRLAGSLPGSSTSQALQESGIVWTPQLLDQWLEKPSTLVPGTTMAFAGIAKPEDRASLIAYIRAESEHDVRAQ